MTASAAQREKLARHYLWGSMKTEAAEAVGVSLWCVTKYFKILAAGGIERGTVKGRFGLYKSMHPRLYRGSDWVGVAVGDPPLPFGPDWIGQRIDAVTAP